MAADLLGSLWAPTVTALLWFAFLVATRVRQENRKYREFLRQRPLQ